MDTTFQNFFSNHSGFHCQNNVFFQKELSCPSEFEKSYLELRRKEGRLYTDEEVTHLPVTLSTSTNFKEWSIRKHSADKLINYLKKKNANTIIEVGCGNGWLIHYLSKGIQLSFCGMDLNALELLQAARINDKKHQFVYGDIFSPAFDEIHFDVVILASCIQYFPNLDQLIRRLLTLLNKGGEIHILDSPIYKSEESIEARQRSEEYFKNFGATMSRFYYHHTWQNLQPFSTRIIYNPSSPMNYFCKKWGNCSPFPWICITREI